MVCAYLISTHVCEVKYMLKSATSDRQSARRLFAMRPWARLQESGDIAVPQLVLLKPVGVTHLENPDHSAESLRVHWWFICFGVFVKKNRNHSGLSAVRHSHLCGRSGPNPPCWTCSGWWVILPPRLEIVHEFTGTQAARRNSGLRALAGGRCRPGSLALEIGQLPVVRTPLVAISAVSSVDPTLSIVK